MTYTVAIVGRPNVGKSTLFNRLVGRRLALVHDTPGLTRDRREGEAHLFDLSFTVVDTAGFDEARGDTLEARMRRHTERAVMEADLVLLLIDARAGLIPLDRHFAAWLRLGPTPVVLVANKCEGEVGEAGRIEAFALGLGEPVPLSAEHGLGMSDLYDAIRTRMIAAGKGPPAPEATTGEGAAGTEEGPGEEVLQLAIVGRPNVGKSTLVNRLIGTERILTGPEAGITRDAIAVEWGYAQRRIRLIDTAGLRRRARTTEAVEKLSVGNALHAIAFAHVVVLVVDAAAPIEKQDLAIARQVVEEGRAPVVALNKWDTCSERDATWRAARARLDRSLAQCRGVSVVAISALRGENLEALMNAVFQAYELWNRRVPTARLNRWLADVTAAHPPPAPGGRRLKLRYITQAKTRPPRFVIFCARPGQVPETYLRYLENRLREDFDLPGTPLRITLRRGQNPYMPGYD